VVLGSGLGAIIQALPFHTSIRVEYEGPSPEPPTASQKSDEAQETPFKKLNGLAGFGLETSDQLAPFHSTMRVFSLEVPVDKNPTAWQLLGAMQETPYRLVPEPDGTGPVNNHSLPFQDSASG
jgi:hypothetical protein